ncbi:MAG: tRNA-uridine aminocarboxypropyltransferase [Chitinispirillaceae bacterium]
MTKKRTSPGKKLLTEAKLKFSRQHICSRCFRSAPMCICGKTESLQNFIRVIILQHPQEQLKMLNSARLASFILENSSLKVGLSWPNFKTVAGANEQPSQWGILYLKNKTDISKTDSPVQIINRKRKKVEDFTLLRGIIALDGSWKQAKAMWWRNPWFLRLNRISLNPHHPSLRTQVKEGALSTIEALAFTLEQLEENACMAESMRRQYEKLIIKPVEAELSEKTD